MSLKTPLQPLINKVDSPHYNPDKKETTIERFERRHTVRDLLAWATITKEKYMDPLRKNKGEEEKDIRKALTYKNYAEMLNSLIEKSPSAAEMSAEAVYKTLNIKWRYQ